MSAKEQENRAREFVSELNELVEKHGVYIVSKERGRNRGLFLRHLEDQRIIGSLVDGSNLDYVLDTLDRRG